MAALFTKIVLKYFQVTNGHLQVDRCRLEDGQVLVSHPGTLHMSYCHILRTHTSLQVIEINIMLLYILLISWQCALTLVRAIPLKSTRGGKTPPRKFDPSPADFFSRVSPPPGVLFNGIALTEHMYG